MITLLVCYKPYKIADMDQNVLHYQVFFGNDLPPRPEGVEGEKWQTFDDIKKYYTDLKIRSCRETIRW